MGNVVGFSPDAGPAVGCVGACESSTLVGTTMGTFEATSGVVGWASIGRNVAAVPSDGNVVIPNEGLGKEVELTVSETAGVAVTDVSCCFDVGARDVGARDGVVLTAGGRIKSEGSKQ